MKKEKMFKKFMNEIGFFALGEHVWYEVCEESTADDFGVTQEQYENSEFMIPYMVTECTDGDRFQCWLSNDFEAWLDDKEIEFEDDIECFLEEMFDEENEFIMSNIKEML